MIKMRVDLAEGSSTTDQGLDQPMIILCSQNDY
jgi:hypothetical protein